MSNKEFKIGDVSALSSYISDTLGACSLAISDAVKTESEKIAKDAVKTLKSTSPKRKGGAYSKGWRYKMTKVQADGSFSVTIYNATYGSLTHLLEKGHPIVRAGKKVGQARAFPHIAPVSDNIQTEGFNKIANAANAALQKVKT